MHLPVWAPLHKKVLQKSPQAFLDCKYKNKISAVYAQSKAEDIQMIQFSAEIS